MNLAKSTLVSDEVKHINGKLIPVGGWRVEMNCRRRHFGSSASPKP